MKTKTALDIIEKHCNRTRDSYFKDSLHGEETRFSLIQAGEEPSDVLMVCHADVHAAGKGFVALRQGRRIVSPALDDRAGLALALEILPAHGMACDVLITDNEETGGSTALYLARHIVQRYNWIVELDRKGSDVVTYDLDNPSFVSDLEAVGCTMGHGSFSDVCRLDTDRCCCNFGIGYHSEHTALCWLDVDEMAANIARLIRFYKLHRGTEYIRTERARYGNARGWDDVRFFDDYHSPYSTTKAYEKPPKVTSYKPVVHKAKAAAPVKVKSVSRHRKQQCDLCGVWTYEALTYGECSECAAIAREEGVTYCYTCGEPVCGAVEVLQCGLCDSCYSEQLEAVEEIESCL